MQLFEMFFVWTSFVAFGDEEDRLLGRRSL